MGQWYNVGLQAGKKVAKSVDEFIKKEHKDEHNNFDPEGRKVCSDGTVIYRWYMKWEPYGYEDEKRFMEVLREYSDDKIENIMESVVTATGDEPDTLATNEEDFAWKLVAVGDEGGLDEGGNEIGREIFDGLYASLNVNFTERFEETYGEETVRKIQESKVSGKTAAAVMADLLMDDGINTSRMFESLCYEYRHGSDEFRKGMDKVLWLLIDRDMSGLIDEIVAES